MSAVFQRLPLPAHRVRDYGVARSVCRIDEGGLAVVQVRGVLTAKVLDALLEELRAVGGECAPPGFLVSYAEAAIALTPEQVLQRAAALAAAPGALAVPAAVVVPPAAWRPWRRGAWMMAEAGIVRGVLSDCERAFSWLAPKAAVWARQQQGR